MAYQREQIEAIVRQVVARTLGNALPETGPSGVDNPPGPARRPILDADAVRQLPADIPYLAPPGTLVTPLAREAALERGIRLAVDQLPLTDYRTQSAQAATLSITDYRIIAIGADHGGYALKEEIKEVLAGGYTVVDCGTHSAEAVDYPDFAYAVAQLVANGRAWRGIIIDGAGIGSCMAANKVPGVRAAMCYDQATAVNSREHNDANVLTLGAGLIGAQLARHIVTAWLETEFGGGRHARRVQKIDAIGKRFSRNR